MKGPEFCGVEFTSPVINAAGPRDATIDNLRDVGESAAGAIVTKSVTVEPRQGNEEPRWHEAEYGGINSMGLPNDGYVTYVPAIAELKEAYKKPVIASVSGFSVEENVTMIDAFDAAGADIIEVNVACPNTGKDLVGYNLDGEPSEFETALTTYRTTTEKPLAIKLPPYFSASQFDKATQIIKKTGIDIVVAINTLWGATDVDIETEETLLAATNGFGGLSGEAVLPIALGNVRNLAVRLGPDFPIIGAGGVTNGESAFKHILCGARVVGVGKQFMAEGSQVFDRITAELDELLHRKGYVTSNEAVGKVKVRSTSDNPVRT